VLIDVISKLVNTVLNKKLLFAYHLQGKLCVVKFHLIELCIELDSFWFSLFGRYIEVKKSKKIAIRLYFYITLTNK
jgi:hypothetical protein